MSGPPGPPGAPAAPPVEGLAIGERVAGSYKVVAHLGKGGMGAVYLAEHELIGRKVAIKVLHSQYARNPAVLERFFMEAKASSGIIDHPGIVEVYDFGVTPFGVPFILMQFLDGENLEQRLDRLGLLAEADAARLCARIAHALSAAHAKGIVHRDIKPANLFILQDVERPGEERIKIVDFGIAKLADEWTQGREDTHTGIVLGTPSYMAPEQVEALGQIDARTDVYALGVVLYRMLAGRVPFSADNPRRVMAHHLKTLPASPRELNPRIRPQMEAIVLKALAKLPEERFQSMDELRRALLAGPWAEPSWSGVQRLPPQPQETMELRTEKVPKMPPAEPATTKLPQRPAPGSDAAAAAAASAGAAGPSWIPVLGAPPRPDAPAPHGGSDAPPAPAVSTTLAAAAGQVSTKFPVIGAASEPMPVVTGSVVTAAPAPGARTALRIALGAAAIFAAAVAGVWITLLVRGDLDSAGAAGPSARPVRPVHGDSPSDLDEPAASGAADAPGRSGAAAPAPGPAASTAAPAAAPAVAPAPPPATRALTLVVAPAEAEVRVDGTVLPGRSPHRLEGLAPGEALEVELTAPGYEPL
ncbi:MAG TPA: serine/threonine-protein kinase, partial [Myxococcota bacterium]|nr:serine/threonine-protein kinase [Myxococcota bacterium]